MTLNQVIKRCRQIAEAHKQVKSFYYGIPNDEDAEQTLRYPAVFLFDSPGTYDISGKMLTLGFRMDLADLVHVSENSKQNEQDVISDMLSVAGDLLAEFNHSSFTDWKVSASNTAEPFRENRGDLLAGITISFSISTPFTSDTCVVPTDELPVQFNTDDMKLVYDIEYVATVAGSALLVVPETIGKKILLITRENSVLHKVLSSPDPAEYAIADGGTIQLGAPIGITGERFLILYRNY